MKKILAGTLLASTVLATSAMPTYAFEYDGVVRDYIAYTAPVTTTGEIGTTENTGISTGATDNAADTNTVNTNINNEDNTDNTAAGASDYNNPDNMDGAFDTYYGENNNNTNNNNANNNNTNTNNNNANNNNTNTNNNTNNNDIGTNGQDTNYNLDRGDRYNTQDMQRGTSGETRNRQSINGIELPNAPVNSFQAGSGQFNVGNNVYIVQEGDSLWVLMGNIKGKLDMLYYSDPSNEASTYAENMSRRNYNNNSYSETGNDKNSLSIPVIDNNR